VDILDLYLLFQSPRKDARNIGGMGEDEKLIKVKHGGAK
jgi:hypothetical protein